MALSIVALAAPSARAQLLTAPLPRYEIQWTDYAALGVLGSAAALPTILGTRLPYATCAPCDSTRLWGIDRATIGEPRSTPAKVSDVFLAGTFIGGAVLLHTSRPDGQSEAGWGDVTVYTQSVLATAVITEWSKVLFHRPRPPRYTANAGSYPEADFGRSFPSGHAATAFASAAAYASVLNRRGEAGKHTLEIVALFGTAAVTSVLRVSAHKHFPTDVMAGAVLGTAVGWVIPQVHRLQ